MRAKESSQQARKLARPMPGPIPVRLLPVLPARVLLLAASLAVCALTGGTGSHRG